MKRSILCLPVALVVSVVIIAGTLTSVSQRVLAETVNEASHSITTPTPTPGPLCADAPTYTVVPDILPPGNYHAGVAVGDFNEDGNQDLLFSNVTTANVSLRLGDGTGGFSGSSNFSAWNLPRRIVVRDFNHDGYLDYAVTDNSEGHVNVRLGDGNGGFDGGTNYAMTRVSAFIASADFNGDGNLDLATTSSASDTPASDAVAIRFGNGLGGFGSRTFLSIEPSMLGIVSGDFNGDNLADLAIAAAGSSKVVIRLSNGSGGFTSAPDVPVGSRPTEIGLGDFDLDGILDFAVTNYDSNTVSVRKGDGNGGFVPLAEIGTGNKPYALVVADLNNDGKDDIMQSNFIPAPIVATPIGIFHGDGAGGFTILPTIPTDHATEVIAIGDFNNDGIKEFASGNVQGPNRILVRIGSCTLADSVAPSTTASTSALPNGAGWNNTDVNFALTAEDDVSGSGVANITYSASGAQTMGSTTVNSANANVTITAEGETTITYFSEDNAGNVESAKTLVIRIDKTTPAISCGAADGLWHAADVSIACSANDSTSGLSVSDDASFSLSTSVSEGSETATAATDGRQVCDVAGNCSDAGPVSGNKVDKKAPVITLTAPVEGNYLLNQVVTVSYSCSDGGSGTANCTGTTANGGSLDTGSVGANSFTVSSTDNAGNVASATSVNYTVNFGLTVLYDQTKVHKSGSTVPIKVRLVDANGANVSSPSTVVHAVSVIQVSSQTSTNLDDAGNANPDFDFRYDAGLGGYIFNLKTTGYGTGSYLLNFVAGNSPTIYSVGFQVRQ